MFGDIFRPNTLVLAILRILQLIKYLKANHLVRDFGHFLYQPILLLLGAGIKCFDISISHDDCVTIVIYYL